MNPPLAFVRVLQIIVAALALGCGLLLAIAATMVDGRANAANPPIITYVLVGMAGCILLARAFIPAFLVTQARRRILEGTWVDRQVNLSSAWRNLDFAPDDADGAKLAQTFMLRTIVAAAMLEGAVTVLIVAYIAERSPVSLALAAALLAALLVHLPTQASAGRWLEDQRRLLEEERLL